MTIVCAARQRPRPKQCPRRNQAPPLPRHRFSSRSLQLPRRNRRPTLRTRPTQPTVNRVTKNLHSSNRLINNRVTPNSRRRSPHTRSHILSRRPMVSRRMVKHPTHSQLTRRPHMDNRRMVKRRLRRRLMANPCMGNPLRRPLIPLRPIVNRFTIQLRRSPMATRQ